MNFVKYVPYKEKASRKYEYVAAVLFSHSKE